jgi:hypothetical protein
LLCPFAKTRTWSAVDALFFIFHTLWKGAPKNSYQFTSPTEWRLCVFWRGGGGSAVPSGYCMFYLIFLKIISNKVIRCIISLSHIQVFNYRFFIAVVY